MAPCPRDPDPANSSTELLGGRVLESRVDRSGGVAVVKQQCEDRQELREQAMTVGGPSQDARECAAEHYGGSTCDERSTIIIVSKNYFQFVVSKSLGV